MIPRNEYPRPQFVRKDWLCLNGEWQFEIDQADSGLERGLKERELKDKIMVPFCPESPLSGIGNTDFMEAVWYRREIEIPENWENKLLLHFQACDYDTTVWVNGHKAGSHRGGFSQFNFEISKYVKPGSTAVIVVRARDYSRDHKAGGKQQLEKYKHKGCNYYRTTGIWQTVWLEPVSNCYMKRSWITADLANNCLRIRQPIAGCKEHGMSLSVIVKAKNKIIIEKTIAADIDMTPELDLEITTENLILWEPKQPFLYDIELKLLDINNNIIDQAASYAGMRSIAIQGKKVLINGKAIFQRQVLDQGYYADGIMTAPSEEDLVNDIKLSIAAGFNSARLHQKVFEERYLYHADRLGYMVWGEFGDWGIHHQNNDFMPIDSWNHHPHNAMFRQWAEILERDYNHPSIVGWCPLNETHRFEEDNINALDDLTHGLYLMTKAIDSGRPVIDASGYSHRVCESDIYDSHNYEQSPEKFEDLMRGLKENKPYQNLDIGNDKLINVAYAGQPYFCSEFGGIKWSPEFADSTESWGYGDTPKSLEDFYKRFEGLINVLLNNPDMFGYCYTQLTDVYQEQNGIYNFDRTPKFDNKILKQIQQRVAAIENE